jgi:hypothetical protein
MTGKKVLFFEIIFWLGLVVFAWSFSYQFDKPLEHYRYGATGWVRGVLVLMLFFLTIQVIWSLLVELRHGELGKVDTEVGSFAKSGEAATGMSVQLKRIGTFILPLVYLWLIPRAGYYLITPFFIVGYMALLGERKWYHLVLTTVGIYIVTMLVFTRLLYVPLPVGNWPIFYDINSFLVAG